MMLFTSSVGMILSECALVKLHNKRLKNVTRSALCWCCADSGHRCCSEDPGSSQAATAAAAKRRALPPAGPHQQQQALGAAPAAVRGAQHARGAAGTGAAAAAGAAAGWGASSTRGALCLLCSWSPGGLQLCCCCCWAHIHLLSRGRKACRGSSSASPAAAAGECVAGQRHSRAKAGAAVTRRGRASQRGCCM